MFLCFKLFKPATTVRVVFAHAFNLLCVARVQVEESENAAFLLEYFATFAEQLPVDSELTDRHYQLSYTAAESELICTYLQFPQEILCWTSAKFSLNPHLRGKQEHLAQGSVLSAQIPLLQSELAHP